MTDHTCGFKRYLENSYLLKKKNVTNIFIHILIDVVNLQLVFKNM